MRVLILSQYYTPEPVPKPSELAEALARRGHEVTVLTGFPNYPSGDLYEGFRLRPLQKSIVAGIPVTRAFEYPYHGTHALGRMLNYATFMIAAPLASLFMPKCDAIYVWHPPLTVGVSAAIIAKLRGVGFLYDVQDIWPESAVLSGLLQEGPLVRFMGWLERFVYRQADHLLVVTEGARENLIGKGVPPAKVSVGKHWIDEQVFAPAGDEIRRVTRDEQGWADRFVLLFAGNLGLVQGLDTLVDTAAALPSDSNAVIAIVGDGSDRQRLQDLVASRGLTHRVHFLARRPMDAMPALFAAADALLVHLRKSELSRLVIPTKTLAYLAAGRPIVMAMEGAAADLVRDARAGLVLPSEDAPALVKAVETLRTMSEPERRLMGERAMAFLAAHFSKDLVIQEYEDTLRSVAASRGKRA
jgi:putative colanic acid biosynthesis glycosyltransferase WcaI